MMNLTTTLSKVKALRDRLTPGDTQDTRVSSTETCISPVLADILNGGAGPGPEGNYNEIFYVIDGEVEVKSEVFQYTAKKGSYVIITSGQDLKSLKNNTNKKVSLLWL